MAGKTSDQRTIAHVTIDPGATAEFAQTEVVSVGHGYRPTAIYVYRVTAGTKLLGFSVGVRNQGHKAGGESTNPLRSPTVPTLWHTIPPTVGWHALDHHLFESFGRIRVVCLKSADGTVEAQLDGASFLIVGMPASIH
jgi:hypothetical protein